MAAAVSPKGLGLRVREIVMDLFGEEPKPVKETWDDFKPNDDDRAYCVERWALLYLADAFTPEVIEHYTTEGSKRVKNKHLALRRWIQRASPSGRYYEVGPWERKCSVARLCKGPRKVGKQEIVARIPRTTTWVPASKEVRESHMKSIRELLAK